jgi:hypothetical protein
MHHCRSFYLNFFNIYPEPSLLSLTDAIAVLRKTVKTMGACKGINYGIKGLRGHVMSLLQLSLSCFSIFSFPHSSTRRISGQRPRKIPVCSNTSPVVVDQVITWAALLSILSEKSIIVTALFFRTVSTVKSFPSTKGSSC